MSFRATFEEFRLHVRQFNWLTFIAIICVAVTSGVIIWLSFTLTEILAAPDWCARAINAEKLATVRATSAIEGCMDLLMLQVKALAMNSHIYAGTLALALLVLVVVVIAKARLDLQVAKDGAKAAITEQPQPVEVVNPPDQPVPVQSAEEPRA